MKKLLVLMLSLFLFSGCATLGSKSDVEQMRQELVKLKQDMVRLEMIAGAGGAAANFYPARGLDGGAAGDLDAIAGTEDKDVGFVVLENDATYGNALLVYVLDSTSGDGDDLPWYLDAADNNDGAGGNQERWELTNIYTLGGEVPIAIKVVSDGNPYTVGTTDIKECYGGIIYVVTNGATITACDDLSVGMSFTIITIGAIAVVADVQADDLQILDGTALNDGEAATNTSTTGDAIVFSYYNSTGWYSMSGSPDGDHWDGP